MQLLDHAVGLYTAMKEESTVLSVHLMANVLRLADMTVQYGCGMLKMERFTKS
jgi:hypothetical protein